MFSKKIRLIPVTPKSFEATRVIQLQALVPHIIDSSPDVHIGRKLVAKIVSELKFEREEKCEICWGKIKDGERTSDCPHCGRKFHSDHIITWLKSKNFCPSCRGNWYARRESSD